MPLEEKDRARRTAKACVICHKKKIRCNIDDVEGEVCGPCARDGYDCIPRERKRRRFTFSPSPPSQRPVRRRTAQTGSVTDGSQPAFSVSSSGNTEVPKHASIGFTDDNLQGCDGPFKMDPNFGRRLSSATSIRDRSPVLERNLEQTYSTPYNGISSSGMTETPSCASHSKVVSYLGRLEYLRNDVPVNDDAGVPDKVPHRLSDTDLQILRIQRVCDLPPRPVRESLMDAFWTYCYPWTPVIERNWVENRPPAQTSMLLQQAMLLAGSRVSAPSPEYPPEEFYKRARVLFWMGAEENPIITLAATCLLHWWNPEGPEQVSLDTSGFWLRICVGLVYQIGLHREPNGKSDAGLRRRIWWSLVARDCLINAGHGRPRALDLRLADVSPISVVDFEGAMRPANLFSSYVGISCILGDLTQSYLRKYGLQEHKRSLEDRLFRWLKTLPENLQLCRPTEGRPLKHYSFEARQLHVQVSLRNPVIDRAYLQPHSISLS
jgi:hypothetical protein